MAIKYYFGDNREYGAEDIKTALGTLVAGGGIALDLTDGTSYDVSALNRIVGSAVAAGVVPENADSLRLYKDETGYFVSPGRAVFSDGGIAVIDKAEAVSVQPKQYLYLSYSPVLDDVSFLASDTEMAENGAALLVPLAYVRSDGSVESRRSYAKGRVPALASAEWSTLRRVEMSVDISSVGKSGGYTECVHRFEGEMNFLLVDKQGWISVMYIDGGATYHTVYRETSRDYGNFSDSIAVASGVNGFIRGTFLEKGDGYIKMRYRMPSGFSSDIIKYTALIGVIGK